MGDYFKFRFNISLLTIPFLATGLSAQSVSTLQRQAEKNLEQGNYALAAALFERAGRLHNSDPALLYRAAEAYNTIRDYHNAANNYRAAKDDPRFPLAYLRLARALKQQGYYVEALETFQKTAEWYRGDHKEVIWQVVDNEKAGCALALDFLKNRDTTQAQPIISWLPPPVASPENEFAPLPFSDTLLYFTQAREKVSVLMRSSRRDSSWRTPVEAFGLPTAAAEGFISGTFSPDGQRFYFARSQTAPVAAHGGSIAAPGGALYVLRRDAAGEWGAPEPLRAYINLEGSSNLWPFVCQYGEEEWLFFSSDKAGGMGGMDLYCCKRPLIADDLDFSFPLNLGPKVNTGADEVTPYYDIFAKTLWFSSMGRPSLGGLDIQHTNGEGNQWTTPENAGAGINSPADDYCFALKRDGTGAFLVSNRAVAGKKAGTSDDDLFEVLFPQQ